ncbi:MAG: transglycosylase domain-containing protein, partial [Acutalibacteraceae bacterium]
MGIQDSFGDFSKKLKKSVSKAADSVKKSAGLNTSRSASSQNSSRGSRTNSSTGSSRPSGRASSQSGGTRRSSSGAGLYSKAPAVTPRAKKSPAPKKPKKTDADRPAWLVVLRRVGRYAVRTFETLLLICLITGCIVGATAMVYVLAFLDKSITDVNLNQLKLNYTTTIYAYNSDSELVEYQTLHGNENRVWVDYSEITQYTKDAAVAVEDERFWKHHGVDWKSTLYAAANMFFQIDGSNRGGSTITQQLIKNVTKEDEVSVDRKLREIFKALELEKVYTKDQILESYLNVIALGSGCNGIQTAAQNY